MEQLTAKEAPTEVTVETITQSLPNLELNQGSRQRLLDICEQFDADQITQLTEKLQHLSRSGHKLMLFMDWAANSFTFNLENAAKQQILSGGLIWHGNPQNGHLTSGSIQLTQQYGWQIHT